MPRDESEFTGSDVIIQVVVHTAAYNTYLLNMWICIIVEWP